jgi:hypothetical protein
MTTKIQFPGSKLETTQSIVNKITSTSSTGSIEIANYTKLSGNPRFLVTKAADQTLTASLATIAFDTEVFDVGSNHSAGVFTAPVTGIYEFTATISIKAIQSGNDEATILLKVNSDVTNELFTGNIYVTGVAVYTHSACIMLSLTAGDTVAVQIVTETPGTAAVDYTKSSFSGILVST